MAGLRKGSGFFFGAAGQNNGQVKKGVINRKMNHVRNPEH